jgi:hypothetical protein
MNYDRSYNDCSDVSQNKIGNTVGKLYMYLKYSTFKYALHFLVAHMCLDLLYVFGDQQNMVSTHIAWYY